MTFTFDFDIESTYHYKPPWIFSHLAKWLKGTFGEITSAKVMNLSQEHNSAQESYQENVTAIFSLKRELEPLFRFRSTAYTITLARTSCINWEKNSAPSAKVLLSTYTITSLVELYLNVCCNVAGRWSFNESKMVSFRIYNRVIFCKIQSMQVYGTCITFAVAINFQRESSFGKISVNPLVILWYT